MSVYDRGALKNMDSGTAKKSVGALIRHWPLASKHDQYLSPSKHYRGLMLLKSIGNCFRINIL